MLSSVIKKIKLMRKLFKKGESVELKKFSNKTIEEAALSNDKLLAQVSLIGYSLHKFLTKVHIQTDRRWPKFKTKILKTLDKSIDLLKKNEIEKFEKEIKKIITEIKEVDEDLGLFTEKIYDKARAKQAGRAYAMGLTLSQAAELTDAYKENLQTYIGKTTVHDQFIPKIGIRERLKDLKKLLKTNNYN